MAHKVHPKIFRVRRIEDWDTRGYYREPAAELEEDFRIREFLRERLVNSGVEKIEIERSPSRINVIISSSRPGLVIGRGGEEVEKLKKEIENNILRKKTTPFYIKRSPFSKQDKKQRELRIEIREIKNPWTSAVLSAQWAAQQIERRVPYRRVIKQTVSKISANKEIKGVRIELSGRLNGSEIARREWISKGKLPRQTIRAVIDYAEERAFCTYGTIGVKVWIYKGEKFE